MKRKGDILFLCQFFHPEYISSAQLPYDTVKALQTEGFSVGVLCGYPKEYLDGEPIPARENMDGVNIHRLQYVQTDRVGFFGRLINYFSFTLAVLLHIFEIRRYRAVVVYSNPPILPWIASWAKVLFGTKLVFVAYDLYPEVAIVTNTLQERNPICQIMNHINKCVYRRADKIVALSEEMRTYIEHHRDVMADRIAVIPNWFTDQGIQPRDLNKNCFAQACKGKFVVSYFGNMGTMQDMNTIIDAVRELKEEPVFFLFAGHGNKMDGLKEIVQKEALGNVSVHGFLHGQDYLDALAISDCAMVTLERGATGLCVPSKTYSYMMQGLPLLAVMDECDIVRDVENGAGAWVRNGDSNRLAEIIRNLRLNPEKLSSMSKICRETYLQKYTTDVCTKKYVIMFRNLLGKAEKEE